MHAVLFVKQDDRHLIFLDGDEIKKTGCHPSIQGVGVHATRECSQLCLMSAFWPLSSHMLRYIRKFDFDEIPL